VDEDGSAVLRSGGKKMVVWAARVVGRGVFEHGEDGRVALR